jgi:hypothetical protein
MDCVTNNYPLIHHLTSMARKSGKLVGLAIVAVTGHNDQAMNCDHGKPRTFEALLAASIGVDSCGKPAIRVKFIDSCDSKIDCKVPNDAGIFDQLFAYDSTSKTYALVINQSS